MIQMPGSSYRGELSRLTSEEIVLRDSLQSTIKELATKIGSRNSGVYSKLADAANFLESALTKAGYLVNRKSFEVDQKVFSNLEVEIPGSEQAGEIVIVGAHYDTAFTSRGANDNGSGVAAVLELARLFKDTKPSKTLRFVEFTNEEPPFFQTNGMGSAVYAKTSKAKHEKIVAVLSLETMGYYSTQPNSQKYPVPLNLFYPSEGDFVGFIGDISSGKLVRSAIASFRQHTKFPSEGASLPSGLPGVGWSDQWSFWQQGYPAIMVSDTAPYRYPHYHTIDDTPDKIDFDRFAQVVKGLQSVIADLAGV